MIPISLISMSSPVFVGETTLNVVSANITFTPAEYFALQQAIFNQCVTFIIVSTVIGLIAGTIVGYWIARRS